MWRRSLLVKASKGNLALKLPSPIASMHHWSRSEWNPVTSSGLVNDLVTVWVVVLWKWNVGDPELPCCLRLLNHEKAFRTFLFSHFLIEKCDGHYLRHSFCVKNLCEPNWLLYLLKCGYYLIHCTNSFGFQSVPRYGLFCPSFVLF